MCAPASRRVFGVPLLGVRVDNLLRRSSGSSLLGLVVDRPASRRVAGGPLLGVEVDESGAAPPTISSFSLSGTDPCLEEVVRMPWQIHIPNQKRLIIPRSAINAKG